MIDDSKVRLVSVKTKVYREGDNKNKLSSVSRPFSSHLKLPRYEDRRKDLPRRGQDWEGTDGSTMGFR